MQGCFCKTPLSIPEAYLRVTSGNYSKYIELLTLFPGVGMMHYNLKSNYSRLHTFLIHADAARR
jgi:hypothetical protein